MNLYLRLIWVYLRARFQPPLNMLDPGELELRVLPNDLDLNRHMNNGRFMTILDLAIVHLLVRTRFMGVVRHLGGHIIEGGALISFRQSLTPFAKYRLQLRYLGCNAHWHVFAFAFLNDKGAVAARGLVKGGAARKGRGLLTAARIWREFERMYGEQVVPPPLPAYAREWLELEAAVNQIPYDRSDSDLVPLADPAVSSVGAASAAMGSWPDANRG
jgi:acyl-CoA thioesterase FadM